MLKTAVGKSVSGFALLVLGVLWPSLALAQAAGPFNVRTYGATGNNNCALDTAGFNAALAAVPALGGEIYVPAGLYCLTNTLAVTNKSVAFRGEGKKTSRLVWTAGGSGIAFSAGSLDFNLTVKSLSMICYHSACASAIDGAWPLPVAGVVPTSVVSITDVAITDYSPAVWAPWRYGIRLNNAMDAMISDFDISGPSAFSGNVAGIRFEGKSVHNNVSKGTITFFNDGVQMVDSGEGLQVRGIEIVGANRGVVLDPGGATGYPGTVIADNHMSTVARGIYIWRNGDVAISNNLLYSTVASTNYIGIHAIHSTNLRISNNSVSRLSNGTHNGIVLDGTGTRNVVTGNVTYQMDTGVWLTGAGITATLVNGNINRAFNVAGVLDGGSPGANLVVNNF